MEKEDVEQGQLVASPFHSVPTSVHHPPIRAGARTVTPRRFTDTLSFRDPVESRRTFVDEPLLVEQIGGNRFDGVAETGRDRELVPPAA